VSRKKTIVEYKRPVASHPIIAKIIRERGWVPLVVRRGKSMYWNGASGMDAGGKTLVSISSDTRAEFFREIHDGRFGEEAKHIIIDQPTYESIYDGLVTWPDPGRIADEELGLVDMHAWIGNDLKEGVPLPLNTDVAVSAQESQKLLVSSLVAEIERRARTREIGRLQEIRKELKGKSRLPWRSIFHQDTIREKAGYAFHYGGRKELQFNVGFEPHNMVRHGVAFSFETSQSLPDPNVLLPSAQRFNEFVRLQPQQFVKFFMWHWDGGVRSSNYPVAPIQADLMRPGVFIFMGRMQPLNALNYDLLVEDFDRLLPLYCFVEGNVGFPTIAKSVKVGFQFKPGCSIKAAETTASFAERQLNIFLRHNEIQKRLHDDLVSLYGSDNVGTELDNAGGQVDLVVRRGDKYWFYEIKTAMSARACIREAIAQLLEYSFWPGAQEAEKLIVVGEPPFDADAQRYLATLRARFSLPIEYQQSEPRGHASVSGSIDASGR
jgi:hypothetical protein